MKKKPTKTEIKRTKDLLLGGANKLIDLYSKGYINLYYKISQETFEERDGITFITKSTGVQEIYLRVMPKYD